MLTQLRICVRHSYADIPGPGGPFTGAVAPISPRRSYPRAPRTRPLQLPAEERNTIRRSSPAKLNSDALRDPIPVLTETQGSAQSGPCMAEFPGRALDRLRSSMDQQPQPIGTTAHQ